MSETPKVLVVRALTFTSAMRQNRSEITCVFISQKNEGSRTPRTSVSPKISSTLEDLGCYLSSQGTEKICEPVKKVIVNVFEDIESRVIMNISGIISCLWLSKEKLAKPHWTRRTEKPAKPYFRKSEKIDTVQCISVSYPQASLEWIFCKTPEESCPNKMREETGELHGVQKVQHGLEDKLFHAYIWCCAANELGRECTSLFTIDLSERHAAPLLLKAGEPLLIRYRALYRNCRFRINFSLENKELQQDRYSEGLDYQTDSAIRVQCVFASAAGSSDSARYTRSSRAHPSQTARITVLAKGFINITDSREDFEIGEEEFGFEVRLKAYPSIRCTWLFSKKMFPCEQSVDGLSISSKFYNHQHQPGVYVFYAENDDTVTTKKFTLYVRRRPEVTMQLAYKQISCVSDSYPAPSWIWRNCPELNSSNCTEEITEGIQNFLPDRRSLGSWISTSTLDIKETETTFSVECCMNNSGTTCEKSFINLSVAGAVSSPPDNAAFYAAARFCLLFVAFLVLLIFQKYKKQFRYETQLQIIQMIGPSHNAYIYIDFSESEYDLKREFPRENLEFGQVLGSGAFGKVVNATGYGISKAGDSVQVAVKMLREKSDTSEKEALMSDLKMRTHIGSHEHLVNLLGACTVTGPIYLIFEYCCYSDLLNYLRSQREKLHWTLTDIFEQHNFSFYRNTHLDQISRKGTPLKYSVNMTLCRDNDFGNTQSSQNINVASGLNGIVLYSEEDEIKHADRQKDEEEDFNVLTFEDLLCFSYQIVKGMEFLESKMCIHRDLAARNVLLTHRKVVKICDFGLARDIMNDSNYVVRGNARLPVKWMAPESLFQMTFTMKSDVWSYGILLWEIFSLGVNPYPGVQVDTNVYKLIQSGFKTDCPYYATKDVYYIMRSCWDLDFRRRPSFSCLVSSPACQLAETEGAQLFWKDVSPVLHGSAGFEADGGSLSGNPNNTDRSAADGAAQSFRNKLVAGSLMLKIHGDFTV
ncbi:LOW QUALITY PROTEIN: receptor-type tyrosine-protein kinase FLT3 [Eudromia elegans]